MLDNSKSNVIDDGLPMNKLVLWVKGNLYRVHRAYSPGDCSEKGGNPLRACLSVVGSSRDLSRSLLKSELLTNKYGILNRKAVNAERN